MTITALIFYINVLILDFTFGRSVKFSFLIKSILPEGTTRQIYQSRKTFFYIFLYFSAFTLKNAVQLAPMRSFMYIICLLNFSDALNHLLYCSIQFHFGYYGSLNLRSMDAFRLSYFGFYMWTPFFQGM